MTTGQQAATDALLLDAMGLRREGRWSRDSITQDSALSRGTAEAMRQAVFILDNNRAALLKVAAGSLPSGGDAQIGADSDTNSDTEAVFTLF